LAHPPQKNVMDAATITNAGRAPSSRPVPVRRVMRM
jgi:hypothetical protein